MRVLTLLFFISLPITMFSQVTSSTIRGMVTNPLGETLPGATIRLTHSPTGSVYVVSTHKDGSYTLDNLKSGGPYVLEVNYIGYQNFTQKNIQLRLGEKKNLLVSLKEATELLQETTVTYQGNQKFNSNNKGVSTNISKELIEKLPTLNRSLQDVTKLNPQGGVNSFAGTNYRFNNLSIDGASTNDALGFQEPASGAGGSIAAGTPGGLARTQPISLDAIEDVQVSIAPYDVSIGNFTGASINAVTRSGTNTLQGSVYSYGRNQIITGTSIDQERKPIADYYDYQTGFRLGGALVKNKLFAFVNYEIARRNEPVLNSPGTNSSNIPIHVAQSVASSLKEKYRYNIGLFSQTTNMQNSDKLFARIDYNLGRNHKFTLRHNLVTAAADNLERGQNNMSFSSQGFTHNSTTNATVLEIKSVFGNHWNNQLIIGRNNVVDNRTYDGDVIPHIQIKYNTANTLYAGTYREASIYGLDLTTYQVTNKLNYYKNKHTFTFGTSNEMYQIVYRFLTAWNGRWEYKTLEDFYQDRPSRIRGVYHYRDNSFAFNKNNPSADFRVLLLSNYVQDEFRVSKNLHITAGIRMDMQVHPDKVPINQQVVNTPEFAHFNNQFGGVPQINPRVAFNYTLNDSTKTQWRGGVGLFTGRIPFTWYAYSHYVSGINYGNIDYRPNGDSIPLTSDLSELRELQPNLTEINLVDNNFKLPRMLRASLGYDIALSKGLELTIEGLYTKTITDILFQSINLKDSTATFNGADNRSYYLGNSTTRKVNEEFTNVFLLTNTNKGYRYSFTASISKKVKDFLQTSVSYTFAKSKDLVNGVRNSMAANWNWNQAVNSNNPDLTYSNFDARHRIISASNYVHKWNKKNSTFITFVVSNQSGSPYSYTYAGDLNNDGSSQNDVIYIPKERNEIHLVPINNESDQILVTEEEQWEQLDAYIANDPFLNRNRGNYAQRNGARTPWNHRVDIRLSHQLKTSSTKQARNVELTLDIFNFGNLINRNWGKQYFVQNTTNSSYQLIEFVEVSEEGIPLFQFKNPSGKPYQVDQFNSRWQAQLGLRYNF